MARKSTRSRSDQPQSNTVLIVFLVFSILLNLALGVFLYLSQDKIDQALKKETDAQAALKGAEAQRNAATNTFIPLLRTIVGDNAVSSDEINAMKEGLTRDISVLPAASAWYQGKIWKDLMGRAQNDPGLIGPFSDATGKPAITLVDKIRQLSEQLGKNVDKLKTTEANLAKVNAEFDAYKKEWNAQIYADRLKAAQDSMEVDKQNKLKQKDEIITAAKQQTQDTTNEVEKQMTEVRKNFESKTAAIRTGFDEELRKVAEQRKEEKRRFEQDKITSTNVPKARIVAYEPGTDMALIDLGSAIKLPLGLTFSVHGKDVTGQVSPRPKAEVTVVSILGEQLAQVRVNRMARPDADKLALPSPDMSADEEKEYWNNYYTSSNRDFIRSTRPIYKGDYLFNVIWDPTKRTRVALVGEFDLDGDGTDDINALANLLRAQGADIDLFLDKSNGYKPKGKLDFNTDLVILGDVPSISIRGGAKEVVVNKGQDLIREGMTVQKEAMEKGIRIIQLPRFLNEIGITPPQVLANKPPTLSNELSAPKAPEGDKKEADPKN